MHRTGFIARVAGALALAATPFSSLLTTMSRPVAWIEADYPEFAPAAGNVRLLLWQRGETVPMVMRSIYDRPALGESIDEVNGSVQEMIEWGTKEGLDVRVLSSVDNLRSDLMAAMR